MVTSCQSGKSFSLIILLSMFSTVVSPLSTSPYMRSWITRYQTNNQPHGPLLSTMPIKKFDAFYATTNFAVVFTWRRRRSLSSTRIILQSLFLYGLLQQYHSACAEVSQVVCQLLVFRLEFYTRFSTVQCAVHSSTIKSLSIWPP